MIEDGSKLPSVYAIQPTWPFGAIRAICGKARAIPLLLSYDVYLSATGFFDSSTSFSKRGSPRNGSQNGCNFN